MPDTDHHPDGSGIDIADFGRLPLTEERRAYLIPRLRVLLADLARLDDLVSPDLEPAATVRPGEDRDDGAR